MVPGRIAHDTIREVFPHAEREVQLVGEQWRVAVQGQHARRAHRPQRTPTSRYALTVI